MSEKSEALRLADALEGRCGPLLPILQAAAELRRLHAQRDALLEALQELCDTLGECGMTEKARAAIKAVEEGK